jgi:hypothetical protein
LLHRAGQRPHLTADGPLRHVLPAGGPDFTADRALIELAVEDFRHEGRRRTISRIRQAKTDRQLPTGLVLRLDKQAMRRRGALPSRFLAIRADGPSPHVVNRNVVRSNSSVLDGVVARRMAVGHSILVSASWMLTRDEPAPTSHRSGWPAATTRRTPAGCSPGWSGSGTVVLDPAA